MPSPVAPSTAWRGSATWRSASPIRTTRSAGRRPASPRRSSTCLRTPPRLGRPFTAEEDRPGAAPVVLLGDGLWRSRFGADPGVVGRVVEIDRARVEIVGVMLPGFAFPRPETALWRPMGLDPENVRLGFSG